MFQMKLSEEQTEEFLANDGDMLIVDHEGLPLACIRSTNHFPHPEMERVPFQRRWHTGEEVLEFLAFLDSEAKAHGELTEMERPEFMRRCERKYRQMKKHGNP